MQNDTDKRFCLRKHATVLKCKDGVATVRVHADNNGCQVCSSHQQNTCALYTFGSIFSRRRDTWQVPSKHLLEGGDQVQLAVYSDTLLKVAVCCYGLPIAMLVVTTTSAHLLLGIEWLTMLIGLGSLVASYSLIRRWLRYIHLPEIQLTQ